MADTNMNKNQTNETMQREQAKSSVAGDRKPEQGQQDQNRREQGQLNQQGREKSAIGGGQTGQTGQTGSQTGEPGRARNELDQDKIRGETDKNRSEPAGQQR